MLSIDGAGLSAGHHGSALRVSKSASPWPLDGRQRGRREHRSGAKCRRGHQGLATVVVWTRGKRGPELANTEGDQQLHYRKVGLLLAGYLMQCHEAHQAPNQHRREEGRRTSKIAGTCPFGPLWSAVHDPCFPPALGKTPRMQCPGGLLGVRRGSRFPQWRARRCCTRSFGSEMRRRATRWQRIAGWGMWSASMVKSTDKTERTKLSGRWDSDGQIWQLADW